jgi:hypothetical protein
VFLIYGGKEQGVLNQERMTVKFIIHLLKALGNAQRQNNIKTEWDEHTARFAASGDQATLIFSDRIVAPLSAVASCAPHQLNSFTLSLKRSPRS